MGHSHADGVHTHGSSGGAGVLDQLAQLVAILALAVVGIDVLMWVLHILVIIATAIGFAAIGTGAAYAWIKVRQLRNRRRECPAFYTAAPPGQLQPYYQPPAQQIPGGGDVHLHLPPGMTAAEVEQTMRSRALPGGTERRWP
jgi:hypothetical protein